MPTGNGANHPPGESSVASAGATVSFEGTVDRIVFRSDDGLFGVARVGVEGRAQPVTVVGPLGGVREGAPVRVTGREERDARYGPQVRAEAVLLVTPTSEAGIARFLGSGVVPGVGPEIARRIVGRFGAKTPEILEREPMRLREIEGIGKRRAHHLSAVWAEQAAQRDVFIFLQGHGVTSAFAGRIFKKYGASAVALLKENPYRLADEIAGIGFLKADQLARALGIPRDSPFRAVAGVLHVVDTRAEAGHACVPRDALVEEAVRALGVDAVLAGAAIDELHRRGKLVVDGAVNGDGSAVVYRRDLFEAERTVAARVAALRGAVRRPLPRLAKTEAARAAAIEAYERRAGIALAPEQRRAVACALDAPLLVITGGPGVGKTTIVRGAVEILAAAGAKVALAAPTGRAAKRLAEATGRSASTVHRLLEWSPQAGAFLRGSGDELKDDVVIVDEASMLDVQLFAHLLAALRDDARLILVGDADQLPSVGPGAVLRDLLASGAADVVRLREIFRQAQGSRLVTNAHRILRGEQPETTAATDFFFIAREEPAAALATVVELVAERIPRRFGLDPLTDIQVLVPMHRGAIGARALNDALQARLNPRGKPAGRALRVGDRVMQTKNDYDRDVWNGDLGVVSAADAAGGEEGAGTVSVRVDDRAVLYEPEHLDALVLAYATTIHKAQGSEYPAVVIPLLTQHYVMLQRNLLYTAVTRARRLCVLVGSRRAVHLALANDQREERKTGLAARLRACAR